MAPLMNFFNEIPKPVKILAPMVGHSEYEWRKMARRYGADICYTEMVHSEVFLRTNSLPRCNRWLTTDTSDRPLVIQVCGNDPDTILKAAKKLEGYCDAIDVNLGCPQNIAKRGKYGSFLQDDWPLISRIVEKLSKNLKVPIFCKIRIFKDIEDTVRYAKMIESSGCSLLAVHGRTREQKGQNTGLASWKHIKAVKSAVRIPVISNGNIIEYSDIKSCMDFTNCDGVMVAETHLHNPMIFCGKKASPFEFFNEYLNICKEVRNPSNMKSIRSHFFKLFHIILKELPSYRETVAFSDIEGLEKVMKSMLLDIEKMFPKNKVNMHTLQPRIRGKKVECTNLM